MDEFAFLHNLASHERHIRLVIEGFHRYPAHGADKHSPCGQFFAHVETYFFTACSLLTICWVSTATSCTCPGPNSCQNNGLRNVAYCS